MRSIKGQVKSSLTSKLTQTFFIKTYSIFLPISNQPLRFAPCDDFLFTLLVLFFLFVDRPHTLTQPPPSLIAFGIYLTNACACGANNKAKSGAFIYSCKFICFSSSSTPSPHFSWGSEGIAFSINFEQAKWGRGWENKRLRRSNKFRLESEGGEGSVGNMFVHYSIDSQIK